MAPVTGSGSDRTSLFAHFREAEGIRLDSGDRERINGILPSIWKKSQRVDWEKNQVSGYVGELDTVKKVFVIYSHDDDDIEMDQLIKLHYETRSEEEAIKKHIRKKVQVTFKEGARKNQFNLAEVTARRGSK